MTTMTAVATCTLPPRSVFCCIDTLWSPTDHGWTTSPSPSSTVLYAVQLQDTTIDPPSPLPPKLPAQMDRRRTIESAQVRLPQAHVNPLGFFAVSWGSPLAAAAHIPNGNFLGVMDIMVRSLASRAEFSRRKRKSLQPTSQTAHPLESCVRTFLRVIYSAPSDQRRSCTASHAGHVLDQYETRSIYRGPAGRRDSSASPLMHQYFCAIRAPVLDVRMFVRVFMHESTFRTTGPALVVLLPLDCGLLCDSVDLLSGLGASDMSARGTMS
nr:hypothetical protein CFP56_21235 [Quercus suber]